MNERIIQKLMNESYVDIDQYNNRFSPEKFAELIVRECAKVADDDDDVDMLRVGQAIKQHFGVKE